MTGTEGYSLFDKMCVDSSGTVSIEQWSTYIKDQYDDKEVKKQGKGLKWAEELMHGIRKGVASLQAS